MLGMVNLIVLYRLPHFRSVPMSDSFKFQTADVLLWYWLLKTYNKTHKISKRITKIKFNFKCKVIKLYDFKKPIVQPLKSTDTNKFPNDLLFQIVIRLIGTTLQFNIQILINLIYGLTYPAKIGTLKFSDCTLFHVWFKAIKYCIT